MSADLVALLYLAAGVLFILALRGLSSPESSRQGNYFGMAGMAIAVVTTLAIAQPSSISTWLIILVGLAIGGAIGTLIARRIPMTAMPQLVAAFHSLVGLAAVFVAAAALNAPEAFDIGVRGGIKVASLIEMSLGVAIGAITFTGSVIAFTKLQGLVSGAPVVFPMQHPLNALLGLALVVLIIWFAASESHWAFWLVTFLSFLLGILIIIPIGGADMPVVISMLNSYSGWAAAGIGFTLGNAALIVTGSLGRLVGRDPLLHHVQGHEPLLLQRYSGWLRRRDDGGCGPRRGPARQAGLGGRCGLHHEERLPRHHRAGLRHGGGPGPARAPRDG